MTAPSDLASVVVPVSGGLPALARTVAALVRRTAGPWELIFVDDGSDAATSAYLGGVADSSPCPVTVLSGGGFLGPCSRGLISAQGEYLVLLRPGAIVPESWLDRLVGLATSFPDVGMAAPMSDDAPGPQRIGPGLLRGGDPDSVGDLDRRLRVEHAGRWSRAEHLAGPCVLVTRRAFEAIGPPRVPADRWPFEDDAWTARARRAGFALAVARDLFVPRPTDEPPRRPPSRRRMRVSLTMIVRDEQENLAACLGPVAKLFDQVVVVDTGSTDRTREVAADHGAEVHAFPWVDDFAAARNASLGHASGDYAFWLDADDRVERPEADRFARLLDGLDKPDIAYLARCACDPAPDGSGGAVVDHIRLFPLRDDVRWCNRVHEQIVPALQRASIPLAWSDVTIRHVGYADPALRIRKLDRDRRLLRADLVDRPGDPFLLFNLGWGELQRQDPRAALPLLRSSLAATAPADAIARKLHALIALAHQRLGETGPALAACTEGLALAPGDPELLFREAILRRKVGDREGAEARWREILERPAPRRPFSSIAPGITGHLARRNLAALAEEDGRRGEAARLWREVLAEHPSDAEARLAVVRLGCREEVAEPIRQALPGE